VLGCKDKSKEKREGDTVIGEELTEEEGSEGLAGAGAGAGAGTA
jgi:hypothetical protein